MSDSTFQELDLDNLDATPATPASADDFEIVEEAAEQAPEPEPRTQEQAPLDDDSEDSTDETVPQERRRLTRSQRLKAQRDLYAQQLTALQQEVHQLRASNQKANQESVEAANIGLDFYIQTIDSNMKALRREFDQAFDAGDRDKIFDVQQKMAELAAEKKQAEREKRSIPTKAAPASGQAAPPQTPTTQQPTPTAKPANPVAQEWATRNADWFNKDRVMTAAAFAIDQQMVADGFDPSDPDYFEELDKRVRQTFPAKFAEAPRTAKPTPTIQNKASAAPTNGGKVKVIITSEDRRMAEHLGIDIQSYAREKAKRERALQTTSQYTEIL